MSRFSVCPSPLAAATAPCTAQTSTSLDRQSATRTPASPTCRMCCPANRRTDAAVHRQQARVCPASAQTAAAAFLDAGTPAQPQHARACAAVLPLLRDVCGTCSATTPSQGTHLNKPDIQCIKIAIHILNGSARLFSAIVFQHVHPLYTPPCLCTSSLRPPAISPLPNF